MVTLPRHTANRAIHHCNLRVLTPALSPEDWSGGRWRPRGPGSEAGALRAQCGNPTVLWSTLIKTSGTLEIHLHVSEAPQDRPSAEKDKISINQRVVQSFRGSMVPPQANACPVRGMKIQRNFHKKSARGEIFKFLLWFRSLFTAIFGGSEDPIRKFRFFTLVSEGTTIP